MTWVPERRKFQISHKCYAYSICESNHIPSVIHVSVTDCKTCEIPFFSLVVNSFDSLILASEMVLTHESAYQV